MRTLLSLCLYLALLHSVASLVCYFCTHLGKTCRHPVAKTCASDEGSCVTAVAQGSFGAFSMSMSLMSCAESQYCRSGYYSASLTHSLHGHAKVYCCQTDKCNNVSITIPEDKQRTPNGLKCPSCHSLHRDHCEAQDKVNCRHKEDHCFYYGGIIQNGTQIHKIAARGCGTKDVCAFKTGTVDAANHALRENITHAECYLAKPSPSHEL